MSNKIGQMTDGRIIVHLYDDRCIAMQRGEFFSRRGRVLALLFKSDPLDADRS